MTLRNGGFESANRRSRGLVCGAARSIMGQIHHGDAGGRFAAVREAARSRAAPIRRVRRIRAAAFRRASFRAARGSFRRLWPRSEEHTSELQSLMRISYAVFCLKKKK